MNEAWRPIPGFERSHEVSTLGRVRNTRTGRVLSSKRGAAHPRVALCVGGSRTDISVHQAVMLAFVGPCPAGMEVCHNDGNRFNPALENLRYDTHANNQKDRIKHGTNNPGEQNPYSKLTAAQVEAIRAPSDEPLAVVADRFGITDGHVSSIRAGRAWRHLINQARGAVNGPQG